MWVAVLIYFVSFLFCCCLPVDIVCVDVIFLASCHFFSYYKNSDEAFWLQRHRVVLLNRKLFLLYPELLGLGPQSIVQTNLVARER